MAGGARARWRSVAAAPAQAATLTLVGSKSCYRAGDTLIDQRLRLHAQRPGERHARGPGPGRVPTDAAGNFSAPLTIGTLKGVSAQRTLIATDAANPANVGQAQFLGSALGDRAPKNGGRRAQAAHQGQRVHHRQAPLRARVPQALPAQRLHREAEGPRAARSSCAAACCRPATPTGVYTVQFDTKRRYSKKTKVWVRFTVTVAPRRRGGLFGQPRLTQTVLFSR